MRNSKYIKTDLGIFHRTLETRDYIFFVNNKESDENSSVIIQDRKRNLVSDNAHAYNEFCNLLRSENKHRIWWMSDKMKQIIKEKGQEYFDQ